MRIVGIDPSLTRTAVAIIEPGAPWEVLSYPTKAPVTATLAERRDRLARITEWVVNTACPYVNDGPDLVLIEGPSHGNTNGSHHDRSGLWWAIVSSFYHLVRADGTLVPIVEVAPTSLKKYAIKGNASKDEVLLAASKRYGADAPFMNNDEADAFILAAMGARYLGHPQEDSLPAAQLAALDAVNWSAVTA